MRKHYEAPAICFDDFSLSTGIAGSCFRIINTASKYACAFYDERDQRYVFTSEIAACETKNEDGANGVCYHVPLETNDLFNS